VPDGSSFDRILRSASSSEEILARLAASISPQPDQWQAQIQALIQRKAQILLYSSLSEKSVRSAHLSPCADISAFIEQFLQSRQNGTRIGVLPQGPLTIPYLV
jgi:nickel-dependent lactate racemase